MSAPPPAVEPALQLSGLRVAYGGIEAVKGIDLRVGRGEIVTLIGSNGAGKTSTLKAIVQLVQPAAGTVRVFGREVNGLQTHRVIGLGVSLVPEGRAIFGNLSVEENLHLGSYVKRDANMRSRMERCIALFPRLGERLSQKGGTLSGGEQQMLAIARALMADPQLLLLDEPSLGLAPKIVEQIFEAIRAVKKSGITILLVEQNTRLALETADRGYVLVTGEVVLSGSAAEMQRDPRIQAAYLGGDVNVSG